MKYVVAVGELLGSITLFGTFDSQGDAIEWAKDVLGTWEIIPIVSPDEEARDGK